MVSLKGFQLLIITLEAQGPASGNSRDSLPPVVEGSLYLDTFLDACLFVCSLLIQEERVASTANFATMLAFVWRWAPGKVYSSSSSTLWALSRRHCAPGVVW